MCLPKISFRHDMVSKRQFFQFMRALRTAPRIAGQVETNKQTRWNPQARMQTRTRKQAPKQFFTLLKETLLWDSLVGHILFGNLCGTLLCTLVGHLV